MNLWRNIESFLCFVDFDWELYGLGIGMYEAWL